MTTNSRRAAAVTFPPLEQVDRPTVDTAAAAHYLNRKPHTLLCWSSQGNGPVCPVRINGRLAWRTTDLRRLLGIDSSAGDAP
jgi:hypothetical protein